MLALRGRCTDVQARDVATLLPRRCWPVIDAFIAVFFAFLLRRRGGDPGAIRAPDGDASSTTR